ncbi:MAG: hypothetical protein JSS02_04675 [Planctomycetes bacterium]|nr:hypothetical protein [Planctomycetota bacterium]
MRSQRFRHPTNATQQVSSTMKVATTLAAITLATLTFWLTSPLCRGEEAPALPIRFGTSGKPLTVRIADTGGGAVVLRALGRNWTAPITPREGQIAVELPEVRVPVAFSVVLADKPQATLARVVVYPANYRLAWQERVPLLYEKESPAWLKEWLTATGLPAVEVDEAGILKHADRRTGGAALLIVGRTGAGKTAHDFIERQTRWQINVLVLEADWFGAPAHEEIQLAAKPKCFQQALADLNRLTWAQGVAFPHVAGPWPGIANRWVWIDGPNTPLVEELRASLHNWRVVFNYLPWQEQLGMESADSIFLSVLKEAARVRSREPQGELNRDFELVWPPADMVTATKRPVLAACLRARESRRDETGADKRSTSVVRATWNHPLAILDLRGPALATSEAAAIPPVSSPRDWVVLGDDAGVELPVREQGSSSGNSEDGKLSVVHLTDDALPASIHSQVRLMQVLTEQGVFVGNFKITRREP